MIHETNDQARVQAKALHKLYKGKFQAYHCCFCQGFHVGRVRSREAAIRRHERMTVA